MGCQQIKIGRGTEEANAGHKVDHHNHVWLESLPDIQRVLTHSWISRH